MLSMLQQASSLILHLRVDLSGRLLLSARNEISITYDHNVWQWITFIFTIPTDRPHVYVDLEGQFANGGSSRRLAHCTAATPNPTRARFLAWRKAYGRGRARDFSSSTERYREKENWRRPGNRGRAARRSYTGVRPTSEQPSPAS